ncbi:MAG: hypothetical protein HYU28_04360 [Actinobacteria bacterium]|nr:hypothetical protein [Actinomycetota bacterium]
MPEGNGPNGGGTVDEGFLRRYRELLDAEERAFDELEHSFEEGDREHFTSDLAELQRAIEAKNVFLERRRLPVPPVEAPVSV